MFDETETKQFCSREFDRHGVYDHSDETLRGSVGDAEPWLELFGEQLV